MPLHLSNIDFAYVRTRPVLHQASLTLETGQVYALTGSNGAGKTTIFNLITGFLRPQAGHITFKGRDISTAPPHRITGMGVGRTFQDLRLAASLTTLDHIVLCSGRDPADRLLMALLPPAVFKKRNEQALDFAKTILEQFFLSGVADHPAGSLSYGQQKLLSLACAVATGAGLLLLDEPAAGVQPLYRDQMAELIGQMRAADKTVLMIEHNMEFIEGIADKVFFLHEGSIRQFEGLPQLRADARVRTAYL